MFDRFEKTCQFKSLAMNKFIGLCLLTAMAGCSFFSGREPASNPDVPWQSVQPSAKWFIVDEKFAHKNDHDEILPHLFFDHLPYLNLKAREVNFVVTTPVDSPVHYSLELSSGQLFATHPYCEQKDIWGKYQGSIDTPPYTEGIIPRMLDGLGRPQKIFVFGRDDYYKSEQGNASHRVRVVGGIVEQSCSEFSCTKERAWNSRLVLLAIDPYDSKHANTYTIRDLKNKVDWEKAIAFMQNGNGRNIFANKELPGFRMIGEMKPYFALKYATESSLLLKNDGLPQMKQSCHKLYDHAWEKLGHLQWTLQEAQTWEEIKAKLKEFEARKGKGQAPIGFASRFYDFYQKFGREFQVCSDLVKVSNHKFNSERHWFFAFLVSYFKLNRAGYIYNCHRRSWDSYRHLNKKDGEKEVLEQLGRCSDEDLDVAFMRTLSVWDYFRKSNQEYYRYIEYDYPPQGTHQKIFAWAFNEHKTLRCESKSKQELFDRYVGQEKIFPEDVRWTSRALSKELKQFGIIY